jgi:hypothetical protein
MVEIGYRYQLEQYLGSWKNDKWAQTAAGQDDELNSLTVEPGQTFRIWIGLNPCVPHSELERRRKSNSLGILLLPLVIDGQSVDWKHAL